MSDIELNVLDIYTNEIMITSQPRRLGSEMNEERKKRFKFEMWRLTPKLFSCSFSFVRKSRK